jgi:hypothetical protein
MSAIPTPFDNIQTAPPSAQVATPSDDSPTQQPTPSGDNWSNWSPDQPLTSYGAATRGAIGGLVSDTLGAVKGAVKSLDPRPQSPGEQTALEVGGPGECTFTECCQVCPPSDMLL